MASDRNEREGMAEKQQHREIVPLGKRPTWKIAGSLRRWHLRAMVGRAIIFLSLAVGLAGPARSAAPITDPSALNIGLNCQWQLRCIREHKQAKGRALKYVEKYKPPAWRIQLCNRNARRGTLRVDWVGFNKCVRNAALRPPPPPPPPRKKRQKRR